MKKPTWKDILYPHARIGSIDRMQHKAEDLDYPFFSWNGRIYSTDTGRDAGYLNEEIDSISQLIDDIKKGTCKHEYMVKISKAIDEHFDVL